MGNVNRLIGDCLELNADIIQNEHESKLPKFLAKLRANYYRYKLIKSVKKIEQGNTPLSKDNLMELALYLYNNYRPYGEYKTISYVKYLESTDSYVMKLEVAKDVFSIFTLNEKNASFDAKIKPAVDTTYDVSLKELTSDNDDLKHHLLEINHELLKVITQYIIDTIEEYKEMDKK